VKVIFECLDKGKNSLNARAFSTKLTPGYCFGMTIDWARTSLELDGVRVLSLLHPFKWGIIQSSYEMNQHKHGNVVNQFAAEAVPDEVGMIKANGLDVLNGGGNGEPVIFNGDFNVLAHELAQKVGTFIFILFGLPGVGAHFLGIRRKGIGQFLLAEYFDPNDALFSFANEREFETFLAGHLNHNYNGRMRDDGKACPVLNNFCGISEVRLS